MQWCFGCFELARRAPRAHWYRALIELVTGEDGQDVVEYGLMIGTVAIVVLIGTAAFGAQSRPWFESLAARITTVGT
jgi:Flp pilus assembly pilin Flp